MWWRCRQGSDEGLNNTRLMRVAGRFARRQRPRRHKGQPRAPVVELSLETPEYDLTILRIRFGRLTLKI